MEGRSQGGAVGDEPPGAAGGRGRFQFGSGFRPSEVTPLVIRGIMYISTPYSRVVAIDPITGKELWSYQLPSGNPSTRGRRVLARRREDARADRLRLQRRQAVLARREDRQAQPGFRR